MSIGFFFSFSNFFSDCCHTSRSFFRHYSWCCCFSELGYRSSSESGAVVLDDCNFHESVRLDSFDTEKTLSLVSEVTIM